MNKSFYNVHTEPILKKVNLLQFQDKYLMHQGHLRSRVSTLFTLENVRTYSAQQTTKLIVAIQGMQTAFVYHYVEQISDNFAYFIQVLNFLILFHMKFMVLHHWYLHCDLVYLFS